jgi:hypothetical protein
MSRTSTGTKPTFLVVDQVEADKLAFRLALWLAKFISTYLRLRLNLIHW